MSRRAWLLTVSALLPFARSLSLSSRRSVLHGAAALAVGAPATALPANAAEEPIDVYFGCGCFWHVQHEFVAAERKILGRKDGELTSLSGYAGGLAGAKNGKVCYHNAAFMSDYGSLGHAEVVAMRIPPSAFGDFAREYFALFDDKGNRPDQLGDRGPEYRNVVGVPGGTKGPFAKALVEASIATGDKLDFAAGKGDDPDARAVAFVMDSTSFPFYQAEPYHQFHDGFNWDENYPAEYNNLAKAKVKAGAIRDSGCPNGMLGVGIAGL